jgi:transposase
MDQPNHVREHLEEIARHEKAAIFALVEESNYRTTEIANMFETKKSTVTTVAKRIRDGDYPITGAKA